GQASTFHLSAIAPSVPRGPFQNDRQVIRSRCRSGLIASRFGSLLTPIKAKGLFANFFTSDRSCGYMARHGGHQFPQKSGLTTSRGEAGSLNVSRSRSSFWVSGAGLPTFRPSTRGPVGRVAAPTLTPPPGRTPPALATGPDGPAGSLFLSMKTVA